jgi:hypothetical protein
VTRLFSAAIEEIELADPKLPAVWGGTRRGSRLAAAQAPITARHRITLSTDKQSADPGVPA